MITLHFNDTTLEVQESESSYRYRAIMQKPQLILKFSLSEWVDIPVGAWCEYQAETYYLNASPNIKKQGSRNIEYSLTMGTDEDKMSLYKLRNSVDKRLKFSMCAKPHEFVQEIVANLNEKFGADVWSVGTCIDSTEKTIEFNHSYIDAALQSVADTFETEWEIVGRVIHLRKVEYFKTDPLPLSYGKGNGFIPGVGRTTPSGEQPIKRLYVQGGEQNIDRSKYGTAELLLPKGQTLEYEGRTYRSDSEGYYIERVDVVSTAVKEDSLDCSEIYPSRVGAVSSVVAVKPEKNFYDFVDESIPEDLNFNDYIIEGETPFIRFQTGMLSGEKDFEFKYIHDERRFEIVPQEIDGQVMPNETYLMSAGDGTDEHPADTYAVFGIMLPDSYICNNEDKTGASWDMFREGAKHLYENEEQKFTFTGTLQGLYAKRNWLTIGGRLKMGGYILFSDEQFAREGVSIRITGIKDFLTSPYSPTLELSNSVSGSSVSSQLREIGKQEVLIEETKKEILSFTKRRFRDARETIEMLDDSLLNFSESINPIAVQTMAMLVGDESLQFRFVESKSNLVPVIYNIEYNQEAKQLECPHGFIQHMTLGITKISSSRNDSEYMVWEMAEYLSPVLDDPAKKYYLYAKVSLDTSIEGEFILSETAMDMNAESGYYYLLVGVLNSEHEGERSYVSLYGFTEILPGRIATDVIVSADGQTYFDLVNSVICGNIRFRSNDGTLKDMSQYYAEYINAIQGLQSQIDGAIESYFYEYNPMIDNEPASRWLTIADKEKHKDDTFTNLKTGRSWRWTKVSNVFGWTEILDTATVEALAKAGQAQDTADGKRRVFVDTPCPPYDKGDLWVNANFEQGSIKYTNELLRCTTNKPIKDTNGNLITPAPTFSIDDWDKASRYVGDKELQDYADEIKSQLDGKAETWYQPNDPSFAWTTTELKNLHKGDLWFDTDNSASPTKIWNGTQWVAQEIPDEVFNKIDGKAQVFVSQPTIPYKKGDIWLNATIGTYKNDILRANQDSNTFVASHWIPASKYTDDSAFEDFKNGEFKELFEDAIVGETVIEGAYIKTSLINVDNLIVKQILSKNGKFKTTEDGTVIADGGEFNNVKVKGSLSNPFSLWNDTHNVFSGEVDYKRDNVVMPITSANNLIELTSDKFTWNIDDSGRIIRLVNYKWGSSTAEGHVILKAPSGKYFYENGKAHSQIKMSRECLVLLGYGTDSTFYGWIVIARVDVYTVGDYGMPLKVLYQGIFNPGSTYLIDKVWSSEMSTSGVDETWNVMRIDDGKYRVYLPKYIDKSRWHVMLTGCLYGNNAAITNNSGGQVYACLVSKGAETVNGTYASFFDVYVADDNSVNIGGFLFQVIGTYEWVEPSAVSRAAGDGTGGITVNVIE